MKINITKPTGNVETLDVLTAFKVDNITYVVFDSEKVGSMGLPIIYISKFDGKLEKVDNSSSEWQNVKNYLKGIINGTNVEYVKLGYDVSADEAYYTPLTLPQASFDLIKSRYVVPENESSGVNSLNFNSADGVSVMELVNEAVPSVGSVPNAPVEPPTPVPPTPMSTPVPPVGPQTAPSENYQVPQSQVENVVPTVPIMPDNHVASNVAVNQTSFQPEAEVKPTIPVVEPVKNTTEAANFNSQNLEDSFKDDKATFLKACENMFDALVSKYQKQLSAIDEREQELTRKEQEIDLKMQNAQEHLANAQARETVANIAHDNAQKVMDLSNFMPNNPNDNQTGGI